MYEGDSFLRPDAAIDTPVRTAAKAAAPAPVFVHGNIEAEAANQTAFDFHALDQTARNLRSSEIARLLKAAYTAVADWLERIDSQERDDFFAASANLADLEQRQRHWERTGHAHY
jgi:hypothetical protein